MLRYVIDERDRALKSATKRVEVLKAPPRYLIFYFIPFIFKQITNSLFFLFSLSIEAIGRDQRVQKTAKAPKKAPVGIRERFNKV